MGEENTEGGAQGRKANEEGELRGNRDNTEEVSRVQGKGKWKEMEGWGEDRCFSVEREKKS